MSFKKKLNRLNRETGFPAVCYVTDKLYGEAKQAAKT